MGEGPEAKKKYIEAFQRSSFTAMLNYYNRNYPREPYRDDASPILKVQAPVLMFHGLADTTLLAGAPDGTWNWVQKDLTLVTVPEAGHFVPAGRIQSGDANGARVAGHAAIAGVIKL